jgi:hypothetical protein
MSIVPLSPDSVHSVLQICELADLIAYHSSPRDASSFARTCRFIFNSLIPSLWENVKGIDQLFALFPDTKITVYNAGASKHDGSGSLAIVSSTKLMLLLCLIGSLFDY